MKKRIISATICIFTVLLIFEINNYKSIADSDVPLSINSNSNKLKFEGQYYQNEMYIDNNEIYLADCETILSCARSKDIIGNGFLRWDGWKVLTKENILSGNLYIPYINDDIYTSMKLPSEVQTFMKSRVNPSIISYQPQGYNNVVGIGAVYSAVDAELPDQLNICIGKVMTFVLKNGTDSKWEILDYHNGLDSNKYFGLYKLPWTLHISNKLQNDKLQIKDNYISISLTKSDLDNQVLHFWGTKKPCNAEEIVGMVCIYEIWSETPEIEGKIAATIGIDQKNDLGITKQAFSGRNYAITNSKRLIIGHNMPDDVYNECVANGKDPAVCLELFNNN